MDIPNYVGKSLVNINSVSDVVYCAVNGASIMQSWADMLDRSTIDERIVQSLRVTSHQSVNLAKMIIASNSDKLTPGIQDQLLEQAKSHNPLYLDLLPTIERREAEESQAGIASSETLEDVMKPYNMLLYHERNSIAKKIGVPEEAMDDQSIEPLENEEINLRKKYMAEILEDCYGFLGEFDPEFVERLRQFDEQKSLEGIEHLTHKNLF